MKPLTRLSHKILQAATLTMPGVFVESGHGPGWTMGIEDFPTVADLYMRGFVKVRLDDDKHSFFVYGTPKGLKEAVRLNLIRKASAKDKGFDRACNYVEVIT